MRNRSILALLVVALVLLVLPLSSQAGTSYLPNCWECTLSTPCEEECGWDPGKGGPVTCGEYGICDY